MLYSFRRCPYAMRARMALHYAGIQCELREILLRDKPSDMLAISPKGTVPVLQLPDGRIIDESLDIMMWALAEHDPEQWLKPPEGSLDAMVELIRLNDSEFKLHLDRYKYPQRCDAGDDMDDFQQACHFLSGLEQRLVKSSFLFGDTASLADVALFPFVRQFAAVDRSAFDTLSLVHIQAWLNRWLDDGLFAEIMLKHQPWRRVDRPVFLISESH
ncbi:MAG: glutathione S-transferase [Mariprofundaceae bacterium]